MNPHVFLGRLRQRMELMADRHDMQQLAEPDVAAKSEQEIEEVFAALIEDWEQALLHAVSGDGTMQSSCPVDGESAPCSVLRGLAAKYGVADHG